MHHTKVKGDIAAAKAIADLMIKGYVVCTPLVTEHLPFDFIASQNGSFYRIQFLYASDNYVSNKTIWSDKNGCHPRKYQPDDFDFYTIYLPDIDKVVYPSIKFGGCHISTKVPNSAQLFYWWEDFIAFTTEAPKRSYKEFGVELTRKIHPDARIHMRIVERPKTGVGKTNDTSCSRFWRIRSGYRKVVQGLWHDQAT